MAATVPPRQIYEARAPGEARSVRPRRCAKGRGPAPPCLAQDGVRGPSRQLQPGAWLSRTRQTAPTPPPTPCTAGQLRKRRSLRQNCGTAPRSASPTPHPTLPRRHHQAPPQSTRPPERGVALAQAEVEWPRTPSSAVAVCPLRAATSTMASAWAASLQPAGMIGLVGSATCAQLLAPRHRSRARKRRPAATAGKQGLRVRRRVARRARGGSGGTGEEGKCSQPLRHRKKGTDGPIRYISFPRQGGHTVDAHDRGRA